jgi:hypothetical protein
MATALLQSLYRRLRPRYPRAWPRDSGATARLATVVLGIAVVAIGSKQGESGPGKAGRDDEVIRHQDPATGADKVNVGFEFGPETNYAEYWEAQRKFASILEVDKAQPTVAGPSLVWLRAS